LILKLYDLRRETVMREARNWMFIFNPTSAQDVIDALLSEHSGHYRMVISYWDMAAAMVNNGAIDEKLFNETNGEHIFVYAKIEPVIEEVRKLFGSPDFLRNLETLVKRIPDVEEKIATMRERMKKFGESAPSLRQSPGSRSGLTRLEIDSLCNRELRPRRNPGPELFGCTTASGTVLLLLPDPRLSASICGSLRFLLPALCVAVCDYCTEPPLILRRSYKRADHAAEVAGVTFV